MNDLNEKDEKAFADACLNNQIVANFQTMQELGQITQIEALSGMLRVLLETPLYWLKCWHNIALPRTRCF